MADEVNNLRGVLEVKTEEMTKLEEVLAMQLQLTNEQQTRLAALQVRRADDIYVLQYDI